ncbi:MAG: hypothetical protein JF612_12140, partial [Planctomycetia bacterium]|nr:hypothetical protein [Planctomycetia bacterium]
LKERGAKVVFECQKPLLKLLADSKDIDELIAEGSELPAFDFHLPLLSVPRVLNTSLATIPAAVPYLFADAQLVDDWKHRLSNTSPQPPAPSPVLRIGINWHGRAGHVQAERRDIPLRCFTTLAALPDVHLFSLQKDGSQELASPAGKAIVDFGDKIDAKHGAFRDTAAIMMNLDLVITSDTSIAHLAGALGVPVWLPLPYVPDWRWLTQRSDSPWYPTMRLFRQRKAGDWEGVFSEIRAELENQVSSQAS